MYKLSSLFKVPDLSTPAVSSKKKRRISERLKHFKSIKFSMLEVVKFICCAKITKEGKLRQRGVDRIKKELDGYRIVRK